MNAKNRLVFIVTLLLPFIILLALTVSGCSFVNLNPYPHTPAGAGPVTQLSLGETTVARPLTVIKQRVPEFNYQVAVDGIGYLSTYYRTEPTPFPSRSKIEVTVDERYNTSVVDMYVLYEVQTDNGWELREPPVYLLDQVRELQRDIAHDLSTYWSL